MYLMSAAWASLAIVLSALGAAWTWFAWRRQGLRGLVRGVAITVLPIALWLTGTLRLVAAVFDWLVSWSTGLVLSPSVIVGTVLFVVSLVLFGVSGRLARRDRPARVFGTASGPVLVAPGSAARRGRRATPAAADHGPGELGELDDIEALLRQRGIR